MQLKRKHSDAMLSGQDQVGPLARRCLGIVVEYYVRMAGKTSACRPGGISPADKPWRSCAPAFIQKKAGACAPVEYFVVVTDVPV
jgi:hypothetical protein